MARGAYGNPEYMGKADFIRQFLRDSGVNMSELSKRTRISKMCLYNFVQKKAGLNVDYIEGILNVLGYQLAIVDIPQDNNKDYMEGDKEDEWY